MGKGGIEKGRMVRRKRRVERDFNTPIIMLQLILPTSNKLKDKAMGKKFMKQKLPVSVVSVED